jgi:hypothetical protein
MDPKDVDDVIFGCVDQVGAQSGNVARNAILLHHFLNQFLELRLIDNVVPLNKPFILQFKP